MDKITCEVCGGTDFMKEAGYYYCNECQTQTQEIREQEYDFEETLGNTKLRSRKIPRSKTSSESNVILTSWEGYNYIMAGLVKELIELGANPNLKEVTHNLWIAYLMELELVFINPDKRPKLGISYKKKDAEIVYQHKRKRVRRTSTTASSTIITEHSDFKQLAREKAKQKRALVKAEYESFTQSSDTVSLLNKTLSSIGSSDDESVKEKPIRYNKSSRKELLRHMCPSLYYRHIKNVKKSCIKKKNLTYAYKSQPTILSRNKLYSILYIALLLTYDDIQLGDMLRFCREGHLSFLSYSHLFPENFNEKQIDSKIFQNGKRVIPTHENIRHTVYSIQKLLRLNFPKKWNVCPDLKKLCTRYCTELNLPDDIKNVAVNLIEKTQPKCREIIEIHPNYEGRAMAFILYTIKLLFGLDGVTEFKFSKFASDLNIISQFEENQKMFVFNDWTKYIEYRKVVLKKLHFPTNYISGYSKSSNLFVNYLRKQSDEEHVPEKQNVSIDVVQKLLNELDELQRRNEKNIDYVHSFTPAIDNLKTILEKDPEIDHKLINREALQSFTNTKLEFLVNSKPYLKKLNNFIVLDKGANKSNLIQIINKDVNNMENKEWISEFDKLKIDETSLDVLENIFLNNLLKEEKKEIVKTPAIDKELIIKMNNKNNKDKVGRDSKGRFCSINSPKKVSEINAEYSPSRKRGKWFISSWIENPLLNETHYNAIYPFTHKSLEKIVETKMKHNKRKRKISVDSETYNIHYEPHKEYWINVLDVRKCNNNTWRKFENSLPPTFQWLLNECSGIIEQTSKDLFTEFMTVELYINYIYFNNSPIHTPSGTDNAKELTRLINKVAREW